MIRNGKKNDGFCSGLTVFISIIVIYIFMPFFFVSSCELLFAFS